jgi:hypothetical protein
MVSSGLLRRVALVRTDVRAFLRSVRRLLVAACVVPSLPIFALSGLDLWNCSIELEPTTLPNAPKQAIKNS